MWNFFSVGLRCRYGVTGSGVAATDQLRLAPRSASIPNTEAFLQLRCGMYYAAPSPIRGKLRCSDVARRGILLHEGGILLHEGGFLLHECSISQHRVAGVANVADLPSIMPSRVGVASV